MTTTLLSLTDLEIDDLKEWYMESGLGDVLHILLPHYGGVVSLIRQSCGITWRPPGQDVAEPLWLAEVLPVVMRVYGATEGGQPSKS